MEAGGKRKYQVCQRTERLRAQRKVKALARQPLQTLQVGYKPIGIA